MNENRIRLFAALDLPGVARNALSHWSSVELGGLAHVRRVEGESLHATLCFLGWQATEQVAEIARACRAVGAQHRVVLTLGRALWLPEGQPRAIAVALDGNDGALTRLQSALSRSLQDGGWYEPERRAFLGHVTVARLANGTPVTPTELPSPTPLRFVGDAVTLYRSHVDSAGARYQPLETFGLNG